MSAELAENVNGITERIDIEQVMEMIPHRPPFLLLDRVVDLVADESATGIRCVSISDPWFQGHFPGRPVMPGVLIVESMAQTAAVLVVATLGPEAKGKLVYFMSVDSARFRKPVVPGDTLRILVRKVRNRGNAWKFTGEARVEGALVAEATFAAMILDEGTP